MRHLLIALAALAALPLAACSGTCNQSGQREVSFLLPGLSSRVVAPSNRTLKTVVVEEETITRQVPATRAYDPCQPAVRAKDPCAP